MAQKTTVSGGALGTGDLTTDAWGSQKVSFPVSLGHGLWTFDIPPSAWFMFEDGVEVATSTDITSSGGVAKLLTTVTNTALLLCSKISPRYQPNRGHLFSTALWLPSKTGDGVRDFGLFTTENGVFFRLKADGLLYAVLRRGSSEVLEEVIDTSALAGFDVEKNNIYDIQFQWRSGGNYKFFIGNPATGDSVLVHTFSLLGTLTTASLEDPALPMSFLATRTTEDVAMYVGCCDVTSENGRADTLKYSAAFAEDVATNGTDKPVLVVYSPLVIGSVTNTRILELAEVNVSSDKKAQFKVWSTRDPAQITGETLKVIGGGSYVETDSTDMDATAVRATAATVANMTFLTSVRVQANGNGRMNNPLPDRIMFYVSRGDYIVVTCTGVNATSDCVLVWGEAI